MHPPLTTQQVYEILSDKATVKMLREACVGLKFSSNELGFNISKKQFYTKLRRLCEAGMIEKHKSSFYKTTTFGSLIYNSQLKVLEDILENYWPLKTVDVLRAQEGFPLDQKDSIINHLIQGSELKNLVNLTHLSSFNIVKDFNSLVIEVIKLLYNAHREIFFASRYHDPSVSARMIEKFNEGISLHILDGNPDAISFENRINAILRTPPNNETLQSVKKMLRSAHFELKKKDIPASFLVVDGQHVVYESVNFNDPEQFTVGIAAYNDPYLAQRFINYFKLLAHDAKPAQLLANVSYER